MDIFPPFPGRSEHPKEGREGSRSSSRVRNGEGTGRKEESMDEAEGKKREHLKNRGGGEKTPQSPADPLWDAREALEPWCSPQKLFSPPKLFSPQKLFSSLPHFCSLDHRLHPHKSASLGREIFVLTNPPNTPGNIFSAVFKTHAEPCYRTG